MKVLAKNRKAGFNYEFLEREEAGLRLLGWQVKSIKAGGASLNQAYAYIHKGEVYLQGMNVADWAGMSEYQKKHKPENIKLLLHKGQIAKWEGKLQQKQATTIVPLKLYENRGKVKVELALARGVKKYDKRAKIREREYKRDIDRQLKGSKYF